MTRRPCTRCTNGWLTNPAGWAVACPNCGPDRNAKDGGPLWLPGDTPDAPGRVVRRWQLPTGHPSQDVVPMPAWVRPAIRDHVNRIHATRKDTPQP